MFSERMLAGGILALLGCCSLASGQDDLVPVALTADEAGPVLRPVEEITAAAKAMNVAAIKADLSSQYLDSAAKLKQFLESQGADTRSFEGKLIKDFDFFTPGPVKRIVFAGDIAFVERPVQYQKGFLEARRAATADRKGAPSLANSMGGVVFATSWEAKGSGTATYYLIRQGGLWKLHSIYFSSAPLSDDDLSVADQFLATLATPDPSPAPSAKP